MEDLPLTSSPSSRDTQVTKALQPPPHQSLRRDRTPHMAFFRSKLPLEGPYSSLIISRIQSALIYSLFIVSAVRGDEYELSHVEEGTNGSGEQKPIWPPLCLS